MNDEQLIVIMKEIISQLLSIKGNCKNIIACIHTYENIDEKMFLEESLNDLLNSINRIDKILQLIKI